MPVGRSIFLVGPMGSGKTAVGRTLASLARLKFYDSDAEVERRTGVDISYIFEKEGEAGFRERERDAIAALTALPDIVLATGGGAVLLPENRRCLTERGTVVYLETALEYLVERVKQGRNRPLLQGVDPAARLKDLMLQREPLYREVADCTVRTDGRQVRSVAAEILRSLGSTSRRV